MPDGMFHVWVEWTRHFFISATVAKLGGSRKLNLIGFSFGGGGIFLLERLTSHYMACLQGIKYKTFMFK